MPANRTTNRFFSALFPCLAPPATKPEGTAKAPVSRAAKSTLPPVAAPLERGASSSSELDLNVAATLKDAKQLNRTMKRELRESKREIRDELRASRVRERELREIMSRGLGRQPSDASLERELAELGV